MNLVLDEGVETLRGEYRLTPRNATTMCTLLTFINRSKRRNNPHRQDENVGAGCRERTSAAHDCTSRWLRGNCKPFLASTRAGVCLIVYTQLNTPLHKNVRQLMFYYWFRSSVTPCNRDPPERSHHHCGLYL